MRIIPTLLWKDLGLVKGIGFNSWRRVGSVLPAIKVYNTRDVDELILLDITATESQRDPDYESVAEYCAECFVPMTVGGGICNIDQITQLLRSGADKVAINSSAYDVPELIPQAASRFGSQCIVASIDVKGKDSMEWECVSHCGKQKRHMHPVRWAKQLEAMGAGEILLTSVDRDGTMEGYDVALIAAVTDAVSIPVIASGGAGCYADMLEAITKGNASAVAAASIFHFTEQTPREAKLHLQEFSIPVRC